MFRLPTKPNALLWVGICLLITTTRLFELGLTLDSSLYASIARTLSRNLKFFSLSASESVTEPFIFGQFYEHPFLAFWIQGLLFKVFGATDLTSRISGVFFGSFSFYFIFRIGEFCLNKTFAHIYCFLCLFTIPFVGRMPSVHLEIPMTFFLLGFFNYSLRLLTTTSRKDGFLSGFFLGMALLCKGVFAIPIIFALVLYSFYPFNRKKTALLINPVIFGFSIFGIFCILQAWIGEYPFYRLYFASVIAKKQFAFEFILKFSLFFLKEHALHLLLALVSAVVVFLSKEYKEVFVLGLLTSICFLITYAGSGKLYPHYFYPIYPFVNLLPAIVISFFGKRLNETVSWAKLALGAALFYQAIWHVMPFHMRKKADSDYYQLIGLMSEFKKIGIKSIECFGIPRADWAYRQLSLWYWDLDSNFPESPSSAKNPLLLINHSEVEKYLMLEKMGYSKCISTKRFFLFIKGNDLKTICEMNPFVNRLLR